MIDTTSGEVKFKFEDIQTGKENFKVKFEGLPKAAPISADVLNVDPDIQGLIDGLYTNLSLLKSNAVRNVAHKSTGRADILHGERLCQIFVVNYQRSEIMGRLILRQIR